MSFQKRSVPLRRAPAQASNPPSSAAASARGPVAPPQSNHSTVSQTSQQQQPQTPAPKQAPQTIPTGTATLDTLLARPAGLPVGSTLLILEGGATDYAGALVRSSAAEGILRGEIVHVVGCDPTWGRSLPGVAGSSTNPPDTPQKKGASEREMKIAWRYERLGNARDSTSAAQAQANQHTSHTFDHTKRLDLPPNAQIHYHALDHSPTANPFTPALRALTHSLKTNPSATHRILLPALLSPALYPPTATHPHHLLSFLHALRALLRAPATHATATASFPTTLHARNASLLRWAEHLADGVVELAPFPHRLGDARPFAARGEDELQGLLRVRTVPCLQERGLGGVPGLRIGEDWGFVMGRRRFEVRPYTLPVEDEAAGEGGGGAGGGAGGGMPSKAEMEF